MLTENDFPALPEVNVTKAIVYDADSSGQNGSMGVDVSLMTRFDFPLTFTVPALGFEVLVPNCLPGEPYISVATARTAQVQLHPRSYTTVNSYGLIKGFPAELITACPGQKSSPLDLLVLNYIHGQRTTIQIRGIDAPSPDTPAWVVELLKSIAIPLPITGHSFGGMVKNFTLSNVHFSLPDPFAEPATPEAQPKISALVQTLIKVPEQMNFRVDVPHVRAAADIFYQGNKLGILDIHKWAKSNSTLLEDADGLPALSVDFRMKEVPLHITDQDTLTDVIRDMIFKRSSVQFQIMADVDAEIVTRLGGFTLRKIPAEGSFSVKSK